MEEQWGLKESDATAHNVIVGRTVVVCGDNDDDDMSAISQSQPPQRATQAIKVAAATQGGGGHAAKSTSGRMISDEKLREIAMSCRGKRRRPVGKPPDRPRSAREDDCNNAPPRERRRRRKTRARFEEGAEPAPEDTAAFAAFRELSRELKKEGWTTKLSNKAHPGKRYYFNKQRGIKQWEYPGDWMIGLVCCSNPGSAYHTHVPTDEVLHAQELNVPREDETYMNMTYLDEDRDRQRQRRREERLRRKRSR